MFTRASLFWARFCYHNAVLITILVVFSLVLSLFGIFGTPLRFDPQIKLLLPSTDPLQKEILRATQEIGSVSHLWIVAECDDQEVSRKFLDDLNAELTKHPQIGSVQHKIDDATLDFFSEHLLLYLDADELETIKLRIANKINPLFVNLAESSGDGDIDFKDIRARSKYQAIENKDVYLTSEGDTLVTMLVKPREEDGGNSMFGTVRQTVRRLAPARYHATLKISYSGPIATLARELDIVTSQIYEIIAGVLGLIAFIALLIYRKIRVLAFLFGPLAVGTIWTLAVSAVFLGHLNSVSAFVCVLLLAPGLTPSALLLFAFRQDNINVSDSSLGAEEMLEHVFARYGGAVAASGTILGLCFFTMTASHVAAYQQYGVVAGVGVLSCLLSSWLVIPAGLYFFRKKENLFIMRLPRLGAWTQYGNRHPVVLVLAVLVVIVTARQATRVQWSNNLLELRGGSSEQASIDRRVAKHFNKVVSPVLLVTQNQQESQGVAYQINQHEKNRQGASLIEGAYSIASFLPRQQERKLSILEEIDTMLSNRNLAKVSDEATRRKLIDLKELARVSAVNVSKLPKSVRKWFRGRLAVNGEQIVYVIPKKQLWQGGDAKRFTEQVLESIQKENNDLNIANKSIQPVGDIALFAGLLVAIESGWQQTVWVGTLLLLLLMSYVRKSIWLGCWHVAPALLLMLVLLGTMAGVGFDLSIFNAIVLPFLVALNVFAATFMVDWRVSSVEAGELRFWVMVFLHFIWLVCMLSFSLAIHQGLADIGKTGLLGVVINFIIIWFFLPAPPGGPRDNGIGLVRGAQP